MSVAEAAIEPAMRIVVVVTTRRRELTIDLRKFMASLSGSAWKTTPQKKACGMGPQAACLLL